MISCEGHLIIQKLFLIEVLRFYRVSAKPIPANIEYRRIYIDSTSIKGTETRYRSINNGYRIAINS